MIEKVGAAAAWNLITTVTPTGTTNWQDVVSKVVSTLLIVAGALAVIYLIYSGILYITAAGNPDSAKKGQQGIINAIIGIVIIVLAYVILSAVVNLAKTTGTT